MAKLLAAMHRALSIGKKTIILNGNKFRDLLIK
jgi:hypothetical protein